MNDKAMKIVTIALFIGGIVFTAIGGTFAYFTASVNGNGDSIGGGSYVFDVNMEVTTIKSGNLIPTADNLITTSLASSYPCEDQRGYRLCSLYRVTLTNSGSALTMYGNLMTHTTTYTTNHLKYRLYTLSGSTYTPITDMAAVATTADTQNPFMSSGSNVAFSFTDGSVNSDVKDYYLVIWLSDVGANQLEDENKTFNGQLAFVSTAGNRISSSFITA